MVNQMEYGLTINSTKKKNIIYSDIEYERWAIRTPVIVKGDDLLQIVTEYAKPYLREGDILFLSEKMVSCTQGRAIPLDDIHPCRLARVLCRFVRKTSYGIGLALPQTMEMAIRECGRLRILFASVCGAFGKLFGVRGWFYQVAGEQAAAIDGPCEFTLPPYNHYVVLGPLAPDDAARRISAVCGVPALIVDINDMGGKILGSSDSAADRPLFTALLRDNPLEQGDECTPMGILRKARKAEGEVSYDDSEKPLEKNPPLRFSSGCLGPLPQEYKSVVLLKNSF